MDTETRRADDKLKRNIGDLVRRLRHEKGLTQEDLADQAGLHTNYIGHVERGEKMVTVGALRRIARPLGVRVSELLAQLGE